MDTITPPEDIEQLYHRQEQGFDAICTELRKILTGMESQQRRFENVYEDMLEQKQKSQQRLSEIQDKIDREWRGEQKEYAKTDRTLRNDADQSSRRIKRLRYEAEHEQAALDRIEKRRVYLHEACEHSLDTAQTYHRLYHQAVSFQQEVRIGRQVCGSFAMGSKVSESLFGTLDLFLENIVQLRQEWHDSMQKSTDYARELLQETESAEQFEELDGGNTNEK